MRRLRAVGRIAGFGFLPVLARPQLAELEIQELHECLINPREFARLMVPLRDALVLSETVQIGVTDDLEERRVVALGIAPKGLGLDAHVHPLRDVASKAVDDDAIEE